jgi:hypothetical protein
MNQMDQIDGYVSAELWACPAVADGDQDFSALVSEFPYWGIDCFYRKIIYSLNNGACAAELQSVAAAKIVESLNPAWLILFPFLEQLETEYVAHLAASKTGAFRNASLAASIRKSLNSERLGNAAKDCPIDEEAWCAFAFCVGAVGRQRGLSFAAHIVEKWRSRYDHAEAYLFPYVITRKLGFFWHDAKDPMMRFIASSYYSTGREAEALCEVYATVHQRILGTQEKVNLTQVFAEFHHEGIRWATETPERLSLLIEDIETNIRVGVTRQNARLFNQYIGDSPSLWTPLQIWNGAKRLIAKQSPHIVDSTDQKAKRIHDLAFFQRMVDAAFWSGLYAGRPEAFTA